MNPYSQSTITLLLQLTHDESKPPHNNTVYFVNALASRNNSEMESTRHKVTKPRCMATICIHVPTPIDKCVYINTYMYARKIFLPLAHGIC